MSEEQEPVRFRPGTKDADLWVNWLKEEGVARAADNKLRAYQERDTPPSDPKCEKIKAIQDAIQAGVLYVDASGIGMVHLQRLESNLLFVKPLPNNQPS